MKKPQRKHVSMDIKVRNEKNEQDQITQKWEKKNQASLRFLHGNIPPWKREQCQRKPPGKEISLQFYIWQNCSSGKTKRTNKQKKTNNFKYQELKEYCSPEEFIKRHTMESLRFKTVLWAHYIANESSEIKTLMI